MARTLVISIAAAFLGAAASAACLTLAYTAHPEIVLEMDRDLPRVASGFHPVERAGDLTFAWTSGRAALTLPDANRRVDWRCAVRLRGSRPDGTGQPMVTIEIDGRALATRALTNDFEDVTVVAPAQPREERLRLAIVSAPTFPAGPGDSRELGAQVDWVKCRPDVGGLVLPSRSSLVAAAKGGAFVTGAVGLAGAGWLGAVTAAIGLAAAQAIPLSTGPAPFTRAYLNDVVTLAFWIAVATAVLARLIAWRSRRPLTAAELFIVAMSTGAGYLKLLMLLHPDKAIIDAVFHAHRLQWVLDGRYYFTQPIQSGVEFPYAIGLYAFAAPWTGLTRDYVSLLRIVVVAGEALGGGLLALMAIRAWGNTLAGAAAVVLFAVVPLPYEVIGNANLTNAFAQSASLVAMAAATLWSLQRNRVGQAVALAVLIALALLSHVSTFSLLLVTLAALCLLYWFAGDPTLRRPALSILAATAVAFIFSVVVYYGHFGDAYRTLRNARAATTTESATTSGSGTTTVTPSASPLARLGQGLSITLESLGWPVLLLALVGLRDLWFRGARDRIGLAVIAWGVAYAAFLTVTVLSPVDPRYVRYADEFIARTVFATYPAAILLAALGTAWAWRAGGLTRLVAGVLVVWAIAAGAREWMAWLA